MCKLTQPLFIIIVTLQNEKTRAMKLRTIANRRVLNELVSTTEFDLHELSKVLQNFTDASDATGHLSRETFSMVLARHFPGLSENQLLDKVHTVVDRDGDGRISYRDFVFGLSKMMRGSLKEKIQLMFRIYDQDGDGELDLTELVYLIRKDDEQFMETIEFAEEVVTSLDKDRNGLISVDEFSTALANDPVIMDIFATVTSLGHASLRAIHTLLRDAEATVTMDALTKMVVSYGAKRGDMLEPLDKLALRGFIADKMGIDTDKHQSQVDRLHTECDLQKQGFVTARLVLSGFAEAIASNVSERARLFFEVYDLDGSGMLDRNEIMHMLLSAHEHTSVHARQLMRLLRKLDKYNDGRVTATEFIERASRSELLMETLQRMFHVRGGVTEVLADTSAYEPTSARRTVHSGSGPDSAGLVITLPGRPSTGSSRRGAEGAAGAGADATAAGDAGQAAGAPQRKGRRGSFGTRAAILRAQRGAASPSNVATGTATQAAAVKPTEGDAAAAAEATAGSEGAAADAADAADAAGGSSEEPAQQQPVVGKPAVEAASPVPAARASAASEQQQRERRRPSRRSSGARPRSASRSLNASSSTAAGGRRRSTQGQERPRSTSGRPRRGSRASQDGALDVSTTATDVRKQAVAQLEADKPAEDAAADSGATGMTFTVVRKKGAAGKGYRPRRRSTVRRRGSIIDGGNVAHLMESERDLGGSNAVSLRPLEAPASPPQVTEAPPMTAVVASQPAALPDVATTTTATATAADTAATTDTAAAAATPATAAPTVA